MKFEEPIMFFLTFKFNEHIHRVLKFKSIVKSYCQTRFQLPKQFNCFQFSSIFYGKEQKRESTTNEKVLCFSVFFSLFHTIQLKVPPSIDNILSTTSNENNTIAHHRCCCSSPCTLAVRIQNNAFQFID